MHFALAAKYRAAWRLSLGFFTRFFSRCKSARFLKGPKCTRFLYQVFFLVKILKGPLKMYLAKPCKKKNYVPHLFPTQSGLKWLKGRSTKKWVCVVENFFIPTPFSFCRKSINVFWYLGKLPFVQRTFKCFVISDSFFSLFSLLISM